MPKDRLIALAAGAVGAIIFAMALSAHPLGIMLSYFSALPLVMAGLAFGPPGGLLSAAVGIGIVALTGSLFVVLIYLILDVMAALVVVGQGLKARPGPDGRPVWADPGTVLSWLALAAALVLAGSAMGAPSHPEGLEGLLREGLRDAVSQVAADAPDEVRDLMVSQWAPLLPSVVLASWVVRAALVGALGQWAVTRMGRNLRPTPDYSGLMLPHWAVMALAAAFLAGLTLPGDAGLIARNMAVVLAMPLFFLGLTVVHVTARKTPAPGWVLVAFYIVFFVSSYWAVVAVVGLGLVEHWIRLRRKVSGNASQEEE